MPTGDFRPACECCKDTGYYGDNGPGIKGNREYHRCDQCKVEPPVLDETDTLRRQLAAAKAMNAEWEQKAANWMASPEAQRQLDGYRELSMGQLAAIERAEKAESLLAKYQDMLRELEKENERLLLVAKYSDRVLEIMQHELKGEN